MTVTIVVMIVIRMVGSQTSKIACRTGLPDT